ncbi:hypothetical protein L1281_001063 [Neisseria sp. HSC-16F19]|nr:hypothetical protein [Neisseria sp. HSC-16F19]
MEVVYLLCARALIWKGKDIIQSLRDYPIHVTTLFLFYAVCGWLFSTSLFFQACKPSWW